MVGTDPYPFEGACPRWRTVDKKFIEQMKTKLIKEKERLEAELKQMQEASQSATMSEQAGENDYEDSFADTGSATFERERDDSLGWNVKDLLYQVKQALHSIDEGTYGICSNCHEPIKKARLQALPYTDTCVSCREKQER
ncbi:MAG: TraR/DksA family transcriptional regulator [Actinobacteria bacterium]|nr:MAG: TraR/DksA family transcriptional regulator [Actinomycetota bacterium]